MDRAAMMEVSRNLPALCLAVVDLQCFCEQKWKARAL
jgi:hypothetical protein